eukprot:1388914-Rhodomonas_salina.1
MAPISHIPSASGKSSDSATHDAPASFRQNMASVQSYPQTYPSENKSESQLDLNQNPSATQRSSLRVDKMPTMDSATRQEILPSTENVVWDTSIHNVMVSNFHHPQTGAPQPAFSNAHRADEAIGHQMHQATARVAHPVFHPGAYHPLDLFQGAAALSSFGGPSGSTGPAHGPVARQPVPPPPPKKKR